MNMIIDHHSLTYQVDHNTGIEDNVPSEQFVIDVLQKEAGHHWSYEATGHTERVR